MAVKLHYRQLGTGKRIKIPAARTLQIINQKYLLKKLRLFAIKTFTQSYFYLNLKLVANQVLYSPKSNQKWFNLRGFYY